VLNGLVFARRPEWAFASATQEVEKENSNPLEMYCKDAPDADECRIYGKWLVLMADVLGSAS
jgi:hypothetical protein